MFLYIKSRLEDFGAKFNPGCPSWNLSSVDIPDTHAKEARWIYYVFVRVYVVFK